MEHRIDFERLDDTPVEVLAGLRDAIVLKLSSLGLAWQDGEPAPALQVWQVGRDQDEVDDVEDDIDTLRAVEKALGKGQPKH